MNTTTQAVEAAERKKFEAWAVLPEIQLDITHNPDHPRTYKDLNTALAYFAWKAGRAELTGAQGVVVVLDFEADEIANACYHELLATTTYNGGMGGQTWDRALVRAAIAASRVTAPAQSSELTGAQPAKRALLAQALIALEESVDLVANAHTDAVELYNGYPSRQAKIAGLKGDLDAHQAAIAAIAAELTGAQSAPAITQEPFGWYSEQVDDFMTAKVRAEHVRLKSYTHIKYDTPLYTGAQPVQPAPSQYGSPELQSLILANLTEQGDAKDASTEQNFLHLGSGASCGVQIVWPKEKRVGRREDMSPDGVLIVGLDNDNDVYIEVSGDRHGEWQSACVEFCNGGGGGGQSSRTRAALINLMTAIEADNAELPHKAFPGAAILASKPGEPT